MRIEDLGVSMQCLKELQRAGFTEVEEVVEFLELHGKDAMLLVAWIPICFDELVPQFKRLGHWTTKLDKAWPSD